MPERFSAAGRIAVAGGGVEESPRAQGRVTTSGAVEKRVVADGGIESAGNVVLERMGTDGSVASGNIIQESIIAYRYIVKAAKIAI